MLQPATITSAPVIVPDHPLPSAQQGLLTSGIVSFADPGPDSRIVVHGLNTLELQCALLRRGCASVFAICQDNWPLTDTMDVVLLIDVDRWDGLDHAIAQAHRVLAPLGTLGLRCRSPAGATLVRQVSQLLALHGFEAIRFRTVEDGTLCRAELPLNGRLARA